MASRRRLTREEKKAQTRARLLRAADHVFAERGFFAASVDEIAERAGFTMGAVYSNFESKGDLFLALFEEHLVGQIRGYLELFEAGETVEDQSRAGADRWMLYLREHPDYFPVFLEFAAYAAREPRMRDALAGRLAAFRQAFAGMVTRGAADLGLELPSEVADQLGIVINALGNGLALEKLANPDGVPDDLFGSFMALLFRSLASYAQRPELDLSAASSETESR
ncbi:MAG: TetR/AcrR family transcriptional regulator [Actinobacteria bacterium]|nr:MAG: TetR/AcrR family transcriptional regulator [Actinomycetota bacterium]